MRGKVKVQLIPNQSQDHELLSGLNSYSYRFVIELSGNPRKSSYLNMNEREGTQMQPMHVAMYLLLNVKICLPLFVKNSPPTNPPAKKITNIPTYGNHVASYCHVYITYMYVMLPTGHFHLIFTIIELSFSGLLDAFKHLSVKNEQRKFQSKENKSILEMQCMSLNFSSIPDVSSGVPRGPYSGCCPSWGWRLMVDVCPCA